MAPVPKKFDYLVLGGGSGGIASARRAAEYGVNVGLIEEGNVTNYVLCSSDKCLFEFSEWKFSLSLTP